MSDECVEAAILRLVGSLERELAHLRRVKTALEKVVACEAQAGSDDEDELIKQVERLREAIHAGAKELESKS